jgi:hypothetical protein
MREIEADKAYSSKENLELAVNQWERHHRPFETAAQIIGGYLEDRTTIAFAGLIEQEFGGFTRPLAL